MIAPDEMPDEFATPAVWATRCGVTPDWFRRRPCVVATRVHRTERQLLEAAAARQGRSVADLIRDAALTAARVITHPTPEPR